MRMKSITEGLVVCCLRSFFFIIYHYIGFIRRKIHQFFNRISGSFVRAGFHQLPQNHQSENHRNCFKIEWNFAVVNHFVRKNIWKEQGSDAEKECGCHAQRNQ